jgi:predicted anti-sigma-YlaC factor YlaD
VLSCREVVERSSALLDGDLSLRERMSMRMHLAMCRHCRRYWRQLRLLVSRLRQAQGGEPPPPELVDRIMSALAEQHTRGPLDR